MASGYIKVNDTKHRERERERVERGGRERGPSVEKPEYRNCNTMKDTKVLK